MLSSKKRLEIIEFIRGKIASVMEWYCYGEAIDCAETRKNINKDLDGILLEAEKKFRLKKIPLVLRVRSTIPDSGVLKIRAERLDLC